MKRRNYHSNLSFVDILFNILLCFVVFFAIAIIHMNKDDSKSLTNIDFSGYVLVVATWPDHIEDDIDMYAQDPRGKVVFFGRRNNKLMHLDRDDLGKTGDASENNREILTVRAKHPGEYIVNLHVYSKWRSLPVPVNVKIYSIKDKKVLREKEIILFKMGEEKTAYRFTLDSEGRVVDINEFPKTIAGNLVRGMQ